MRIVHAVIAVFIFIMFMAWVIETSPDTAGGKDAFWIAVAIVAAGAMAGGD